MRYLGTIGSQPLDPNGQAMDTRFHHADLIGSVWLTTSSAGEPAGRVSYTAFGELLCGHGEDPEGCEPGWPGGSAPEGFPRYEYAGLWGYESAGFGEDPFGLGTDRSLLALGGVNPRLAAIRLLHVGWRWYQPDIGRFIQRDPLGLHAGVTTALYAYVHNRPTAGSDPLGLIAEPPEEMDVDDVWWKIRDGAKNGALEGMVVGAAVSGGNPLGALQGGLGGGVAGAVKPAAKFTWSCTKDIFYWLGERLRREDENARQRRRRPDVFPPAPPESPPI